MYSTVVIVVVAIIASIFATANSSIVLKAFNANNKYKEDNKNSFNYSIFSLVISIVLLIASIIMAIVMLTKSKNI
jgi:uncharacterized BrkB/YihY/UPF0761 family membrane protein